MFIRNRLLITFLVIFAPVMVAMDPDHKKKAEEDFYAQSDAMKFLGEPLEKTGGKSFRTALKEEEESIKQQVVHASNGKRKIDASAQGFKQAAMKSTQQGAQQPVKKIRTVLGVLPKQFSKIPEDIWQDRFSPFVDHSSMVFPVRLKLLNEPKTADENLLLHDPARRLKVLKNGQSVRVMLPARTYDVVGELCAHNGDSTLVACREKETGKIKIIETQTGKTIQEIVANNIWDDLSFISDHIVCMRDRRAKEGQAGIRIFDLSKPQGKNCWPIPNSNGYNHIRPIRANGQLIVGDGEMIRIYDMETKEVIHRVNAEKYDVSHNERYLAAEHNSTIKVFDLQDPQEKGFKEKLSVSGRSDIIDLSMSPKKIKSFLDPLNMEKSNCMIWKLGKSLLRLKVILPRCRQMKNF